MLQIFIHNSTIDDVAYASHACGVPEPERDPLSESLAGLKMPDGQARLIVHPSLFTNPRKMKCFHYAAEPQAMEGRVQLQRRIQQALAPVLGDAAGLIGALCGVEGLPAPVLPKRQPSACMQLLTVNSEGRVSAEDLCPMGSSLEEVRRAVAERTGVRGAGLVLADDNGKPLTAGGRTAEVALLHLVQASLGPLGVALWASDAKTVVRRMRLEQVERGGPAVLASEGGWAPEHYVRTLRLNVMELFGLSSPPTLVYDSQTMYDPYAVGEYGVLAGTEVHVMATEDVKKPRKEKKPPEAAAAVPPPSAARQLEPARAVPPPSAARQPARKPMWR
eukprot:TRINITY_DN1383_c0_g1_i5.p1 TRINITY_DN1383_c0_g1~~TRINITY_DN1383_c0_g1_i5.p1  ORF type:complete len:333 (+),score=97.87 TRINITY_DN1383_c0_g1_i5:559-1557(+)